MTVAYIAASAILYGLWRKKPKDIRYPVNVMLTDGDHQEMYLGAGIEESEGKSDGGDGTTNFSTLIFMAGLEDNDITSSLSVPTFYSGAVDGKNLKTEDFIGTMANLSLGCIFGAIHCIAWSFKFQSHAEQLIWRISSAVVTGVPLLIIVSLCLGLVGFILEQNLHIKIPKWISILVFGLPIGLGFTVGFMAYAIARFLLIAIAFLLSTISQMVLFR
jgi:hypothetical protein